MPNSLSIDQIQQLKIRVANGDIIGVYAYLSEQGYNYAGWAGGVAAGDTISGVAALDFMEGTALMGVGGPECQMLSAEKIQNIKSDMANAYLNTLLAIAKAPANNGYVNRDISAKEVWTFHSKVFSDNGLSIDNWTLNAPFQIIQKLEGDEGLERYWSDLRDTKGTNLDAIIANLRTLDFMHKQASSSDQATRDMANDWLQHVPGIYNWDQIEKTLRIAETAFGAMFAGVPSLGGESEWLTNLIFDLQKSFHTAEVTLSPLILDLNGNGVETISKTAGIHFDHDGNHFAETTGWAGKDDGLLVWDRNGNGKIDDGSELFGNNTNLAAGGKAANGFAALADLDSNHDGKIDANDTAFNQLRVWKDGDSNAVVSSGELLTLTNAGIQSIATGFSTQNITDAQGNQHLQTGQYIGTDGTIHAIEDVWFAADTARTVDLNLVTVNATIATLPDLQGFGNVHSLHQAMARDTTGRLQSLVASFANETNADARAAIMTTLMYAWAGVEGIDPASRAATQIYGNAIGDARKLATLEAFLGEGYLGTWCWGARDPNPHGRAAPILIKAFDQLMGHCSAQLMAQTQFKTLYDGIGLTWNTTTSSFDIDVTHVVALLQSKYEEDPANSAELMNEFGRNLKSMGDFGVQTLTALSQEGDTAGTGFALQLSQIGWEQTIGNNADNTLYGNTDHNNNLSGLTGNDHLYGKNLDDILDGGSGDDWLFGDLGNDVFKGGTGNDYQVGGGGNDTYFFNEGDGQDTIIEYANEGEDVLQIGAGLNSTNTQISREIMDLVLNFSATDSVRIVGYFNNNVVEKIQFADGTKWDYQTVASKLVYNGTAGNDTLTGLSDAPNVINGADGNDTINAGNLNDTLAGGGGNDTLNGGVGLDTFVFNQGDGQDVINEMASYAKTGGKNLDVLQLGAGLPASATQVTRGTGNQSYDLTLGFGSGDQITLSNYFSSSYHLQTIQFADGTKWDYQTVAGKLVYNGTAGNDTLTGLPDAPNVINGADGNDTINAGNLNDTLAGGGGNDTLNGGVGLDTFIFNQGDGQDVINEMASYAKTAGKNLDVLQLGAGLLASATQAIRGTGNKSYDLTLVFGSGDQITLNSYFSSSYRLQTIQFADGTKWDYQTVAGKLIYNGTAGNDTLTGLPDAPNVINGADGNDTINAGNLNDTLAGGTGNDTLNGGVGLDTFAFNQGDGQDVINEIASYAKTGGKNLDVLQLGAGLLASATQAIRGTGNKSYDLTLVFGSGDQITLNSYFSSSYRLQTIQFADGTKWDYQTVAGKLVYNGTAGNDTLTGLPDAPNVINGAAGNDTISGGSQTDVLNGGDDNDVITAGSGNATLTGGTGADTLNGGAGIDTFVFNQGDGQDVINEMASYAKTGGKNLDVLQLGAGLLASATQAIRGTGNKSYDLTLVFGSGDQITLNSYFSSSYRLQTIQFADGTKWDYQTAAGKLIYNGTAGNDTLTGLPDAPNVINGADGNDTINAGNLNDTLAGGGGNDTLNGGVGLDTFIFNQGDGQDVINEMASYAKTDGKNLDVLQLGAGLLASATQAIRGTGNKSYDLTLVFGSGDQITLNSYFSSSYRLQTIQFADGTKWDYQTVAGKLIYNGTTGNDTLTGLPDAPNVINGADGNDTINAGNLNDTLAGGTGKDTLNGGVGLDTFVFNQGDGQDVINEIASYAKTGGKNLDVLQLGAGLLASATQAIRGTGNKSYDLTLVFGSGDQITLNSYFSSSYRLQTIQFADGTKWDYQTVAGKLVYNGTAGNDTLTGLPDAPNVINGAAGNDTISGGSQTDVLNGGDDNDVITAGSGNATLTGGTGADTLNGGAGIDTFVFNQGDGQDVINEMASYAKTGGKNLDVLQLGAGLLASATQAIRGTGNKSYDLTLVFGSGDQITLNSYFSSSYRLQTIQFADGTKWDYQTVAGKLVYNGTTGNDTLTGLPDAPNVINGADGNDTINAGNLNDTLAGGTGNDTLNGGVGLDTFVFNQGDGQDVINEIASYAKTGGKNLDVLQLGAGLLASATQAIRGTGNKSYDLTLVFGSGDQITLNSYFSSYYRLQTIRFADGTKWDYQTVAGKLVYNGTAGNDTLTGLPDAPNIINGAAGNDTISGGSQTDVLNGGDDNDVITAGNGNATLTGGTGADTLNGGAGIDTFVFNQGDGQDVINEMASYAKTGGKNLDVLQLGAGLLASATQAIRGTGNKSYDLTLVFGSGDQITLNSYFSSSYRLQTIQFADGTKWDYQTVAGKLIYNGTAGNDTLTGLPDAPNVINGADGNDTINAGNLNDTLAGGGGNDTLNGGVGLDTFVFNQGDGQDVINEMASYSKTGGKNLDVLQLGAGLLASATQAIRGTGNKSYDLTLVFGSGDQITLNSYFSSYYRLQTIRFADGTKWDYQTVAGKLVYNGTAGNDTLTGLPDAPNVINGAAGNDTISGGSQTDVLNGGDDNDVITAGNGNATLTGGTGADTLNGGAGIDTFVFNQGDGQDVINEMASYAKTGGKNLDVLQLGAGLLASATQVTRGAGGNSNDLTLVFGGGDQITLRSYFNSTYRLQTIQFADGTKWDYQTVAAKLVYNGTAGNDTLTGLSDAPNVINGAAGNDIIKAGNLNDTLAGGGGNDTLNGGVGLDTFVFNQGDGQDVINEIASYAKTGGKNLDVLQLGAGIDSDQLWFRHIGNNLEIDVIGTTDRVTINNWYSGSAYHVNQMAANGKNLLETQVENLVAAMAAFNPPAAGQTTLPADYETALAPVLAANWK